MLAYIVRRLVLMVPVLFGISLIQFVIVNLAPAQRNPSVSAMGVRQQGQSAEAGESQRIFRETFNLDKPVLFNTRFALGDPEIFWRLTSPLRTWELPKDRIDNRDTLEDYGRVIVPRLLRIVEAAASPDKHRSYIEKTLRPDYERRWKEARASWMAEGRPSSEIAWPPPETPPAFDHAFFDHLLGLGLTRLYVNAQRRPKVVYGGSLSEMDLKRNRAIRSEREVLHGIYVPPDEPIEKQRASVAKWKKWVAAHSQEWNYGFWGKVKMFFLDTRFAKYWSNLFSLDLGSSFIFRRPVTDLILERLHISLTLALGALILSYLISIPIGIFSAVKDRSLPDRAISTSLFALYSLPSMFLAVLLLQYLAIDVRAFPVNGFQGPNYMQETVLGKMGDVIRHMGLPWMALTLPVLAVYSRFMKSGLIETLRSDYIRTARAKGLSGFVVVMKHAVRNGLLPIITLLASSLPVLIGGSIVIEYIFNIDGMGHLAYFATVKTDYAVIMGLNIITAFLTVVGLFLGDIAYAIADPRIRLK